MSFSPVPLVRRLLQPVTTNNAANPQTLSASFVTLGVQFAIAHASQMAVKMNYLPTVSAGTRKLSTIVEVSDDPIDTAESSSTWYQMGDQDNVGGTLTQEPQQLDYQVTAPDGATTFKLVPWQMSIIAVKARIRVKEDGSSAFGTAQASVGLLRLV